MVDVKRYGDAVGASANAARSAWTGAVPHAGSLPGAAGEGGLLATFDAIFEQTMKPQPTAVAPVDSSPVQHAAPPARDEPELRRAADEEQDEKEKEDAPQAVPTPLALADPQTVESPAPVAPEETAVSEEDSEMEAAAAAGAKTEQPVEEADAEAGKQAEVQGKPTPIEGRSQLPAEKGDRAATPSQQAADTAGAAEPAKAVEMTAERATAAQAAAPKVEASVDGSGETAVERPVLAAQETPSGAEAGDEKPTTDEPAAVDEGVSEEDDAEQPSLEVRGGRRDRTSRERNSRHRSDDPGERPTGPQEMRAPEAVSGNRAVDRMVAQMQPLESGEQAAPQPPGAAPPIASAASAAAFVASSAATASPAATAAATDSSAPSENRFSVDQAGEKRSVGGVKSEAASAGEGGVRGGSNAEQVRLVQRIARAFQRLGPTGGRVQVMLHPAELGSVRLDLRIEGNRMNARMTAETDAARSVLSDHLPELRQRLAESGLIVDRVDVEVEGRGQQEEAGQGREGMSERRDGFHSAPHRHKPHRTGASPSDSAGGKGAIASAAGPPAGYSRSALDLMA